VGYKVVQAFSFFLFLWTLSPEAWACKKAISELQKALIKAQFDLKVEGTLSNSPRIKGRPLHFTSQMALPFVWVTNTAHGTNYSVLQKSQSGFGFSAAPVSEFSFLKSESLYLRSLDVSGDQNYMLATLLHEDQGTKVQKLLLNIASISDATSGRLAAAEHEPVVFEDVLDPRENLVISVRPGTGEFWLTDSSHKIRVVEFSREKGLYMAAFEVPTTFRIGKKNLSIEKVLKLQFFSDALTGYFKFQASDGKIYIAPVHVLSSDDSEEDQVEGHHPAHLSQIQLSINYEKSKSLGTNQIRSSTHPEKNLVFISYPDHIEIFRVGEQIRKVADLDVSHLKQGYLLDGIEFYWEGQWVKESEESEEAPKYHGQVKAFLMLWDQANQETRLSWVQLGG
jgi:hypothetical protein